MLQHLIESQMETYLGVRFLATECSTDAKHRGRIDSLGLDQNGWGPCGIGQTRATTDQRCE